MFWSLVHYSSIPVSLGRKTALPEIRNFGEIVRWKRNVAAGSILAHLLVVARPGDRDTDGGMGDAKGNSGLSQVFHRPVYEET
jgi:hypothetical protein